MHNRTAVAIAVASFIFMQAVVADAEDATPVRYQHAALTSASRSLQNRLRFPNVKHDRSVELLCSAKVDRHGRLRSNACYSEAKDANPFRRTVRKAASRARIQPATVDGQRVAVLFQYTVKFVRKNGVNAFVVLPNHGWNREAFGINYYGAQWYWTPDHDDDRVRRDTKCLDRVLHSLGAIIDVNGKAQEIEVIASKSTPRCEAWSKQVFAHRDFIPVLVQGQPVASEFREVFATRDMIDELPRERPHKSLAPPPKVPPTFLVRPVGKQGT